MRTALTKALVLSLVVAAGLLAAPQAHAQLGFGVGLNFAEFDDIQAGTDQAAAEATYENSTGYHIGLFYDLAVGPLALRPGVYYRQSGKFEVPSASDVVGARDEFNLSLIEIPIDLRLRLATIPIVKPYLLGGPVLMFPQGEDDLQDGLEEFSFGGNVGAGVEVNVPIIGLRPMLELRYSFSGGLLADEEFTLGGVQFNPDDAESLSAWMIRLNISL